MTHTYEVMKLRLDRQQDELSQLLHNDTGQDKIIDSLKTSLDKLRELIQAGGIFSRIMD